MSLFSSIRMASNTLKADQIAMQVIGQNIANANTPDYIREEVILSSAPTQRLGGLLLGMGVEVEAVVQKIDRFLEERLRGAVSERASTETQEETYLQLEQIVNELTDMDLSTSLNDFFSSISEIMNQPENVSVRNLAVLQGLSLTSGINRLAEQVAQIRGDLNGRVEDIGERINRLISEIRDLNVRIAEMEGGNVSQSDAVGLRDQRLHALQNLAELIDIRVEEQPSGGVAVYNGGSYLVFEGSKRDVKVVWEDGGGMTVADLRLVETDSRLNAGAGEFGGLIASRDDILGGFYEELDEFAQTLAFEFNKVFSAGQGLSGFQELTSEFSVDASDVPLDEAGLPFTPQNGSFQVLVRNQETGLSQTTDVLVDLNGLGDDTTLDDLAAALDAIDGISAGIAPTGELTITSDSPELEFAFADDTSGVLAALGMNTFFSGSTARDLSVNPVLLDDPTKFAASRSGIGAGTENLSEDANGIPRLAGFLDRPIESRDGASLAVVYDQLVAGVTQGSRVVQAAAESARVFEETLYAQKMSISGVSLDEEAVRLMAHQSSFQASARYIATLHELLMVLVNL